MKLAVLVIALLRCAASSKGACREWEEDEWNLDDDCCAGVEQAACEPGYKYVQHDEVCAEWGFRCEAYKYSCVLCDEAEACDSNYDTATEDGVNYTEKCGDGSPWSACYFLWAIQLVWLYCALKKKKGLLKNGMADEAHSVWACRKGVAVMIFGVCTVMHFVALVWMPPDLMGILIAPCFFIGILIPIIMCKHGDGVLANEAAASAAAPAAAQAVVTAPSEFDKVVTGKVVVAAPVDGTRVVTGQILDVVIPGDSNDFEMGTARGMTEPSMEVMVENLKRELGLSGPYAEVVDAACAQLGVPREGAMIEKARACHRKMHG